MRLAEIINRRNAIFPGANPTQGELQRAQLFFADAVPVDDLEGGKFALAVKDGFFVLKQGEEALVWLSLKDTTAVPNAKSLDLIFALPKARGRAIAAFIMALQRHLKTPIYIAPDEAVFMDGARMLLGLVQRKMIDVEVEDGGKLYPFTSIDDVKRTQGLLITSVPPSSTNARDLLGRTTGKKISFEWLEPNPTDALL